MPKYFESIEERDKYIKDGALTDENGKTKIAYVPLGELPLLASVGLHTIVDVDNNFEEQAKRIIQWQVEAPSGIERHIITALKTDTLRNLNLGINHYRYVADWDRPYLIKPYCFADVAFGDKYGLNANNTEIVPRHIEIGVFALDQLKVDVLAGLVSAKVGYVTLPGFPAPRSSVRDYELKLSLELQALAHKSKEGPTRTTLERAARQLNPSGLITDIMEEINAGWEE